MAVMGAVVLAGCDVAGDGDGDGVGVMVGSGMMVGTSV